VPDWRGTCAICLDLLSLDSARENSFLSCCCKKLCTECAEKSLEYDNRCPLCREPAAKSEAELLRRLQKNADEGHAEAQVQLGDAYSEGAHGLKKSLKRALPLFEAAAAQGNLRGQVKLGECYQLGNGVKINFKTAAQWFRRAAEQGHPFTQYRLGALFFEGKGVAQSDVEALKWYRLAAAQGNADALYDLGACHVAELSQHLAARASA